MPVEVTSVVELESSYVLQNYARHPLVLARGDGPYMWDIDGKRYLDFIAGIGVNALGQNHPRIVNGDPGTGGAADPYLEPVLQRVSGAAGEADRRSERPRAHIFHEQRHGIVRGRA